MPDKIFFDSLMYAQSAYLKILVEYIMSTNKKWNSENL